MKKITYISGGARSGKSNRALEIAEVYPQKAFIATGQPFDQEMKDRIKKHKQDRNSDYTLIEEALDLDKVLPNVSAPVVIIDCLTTWLGNLFHHDLNIPLSIQKLLESLQNINFHCIIVSNELGMGLVPSDSISRKFRDEQGYLNKEVAKIADEAIFMVSGLPLKIK